MREIKFRKWNIIDKTMDYEPDGNMELNELFSSGGQYGDYYMQYTEVKDKNKKEIYECDIIKSYNNTLYEIRYDNGAFCLWLIWHGGFTDSLYDIINGYDRKFMENLEIIGNRFENKNLLNNE
jgi:hypothetical protein